MGWFSSLFTSQRTRNSEIMSTTHDVFSLPTSSPVPHRTSFADPITPSTSTYTYPPPSPAYGFLPTSARSTKGSASLLPTYMDPPHTPLSPATPYPPLATTWARIRAWLAREYPELGDTLNYGMLPADLQQVEHQFGFSLPAVVRESYLCVDGQEAESAAGCSEGLFFGLRLLPLEDVYEEWRFWREVDSDPSTGANPRLRELMQSIPPGWVRREYSQRGWIPLIADKAGNYVGVDMNPDQGGAIGQVIVFGRDFDTKVVLWRGDGAAGWASWLASFAEELENGEGYELGQAEASDDGEDDLGYEGYFYDGKGRGQGDGGGDNGVGGGLRLIGEYKGWNIMEAWADRSVRKWHEAGVITDVPLLPPEEEAKGKDTSKEDIPNSVLADVDEPPTPVNGTMIPRQTNIPAISVTKPPAPQPVDLPTAQDITDSLYEEPSSYDDDDLERGRRSRSRDVSPVNAGRTAASTSSRRTVQAPQPITSMPRKGPSESTVDSEGPLMSPPVDATTPLVPVSSTANSSSDPLTANTTSIPDLLVDADEGGAVIPLETIKSSSSEGTAMLVQDKPLSEESNVVQPAEVVPEMKVEEEEKVEDPLNTVRLVGGGGTAGIVSDVAEPEAAVEPERSQSASPKQVDSDTASINSQSSTKGKKQGHKKTRSGLASLKRFSQFGGGKKGTKDQA